MELLTRYKATLSVSEQEIQACCSSGNAYYADAILHVFLSPTYIRPSRANRITARIRAQQQNWVLCFQERADERILETVLAHVLEWGQGSATCAICNDIFLGAALRVEEAFLDGIYRRRFFCPSEHLLWVTPESILGEISIREYDWRRIRRSAPWLPAD